MMLWDAMIVVHGLDADIITLTIHTNITIQELRVKTARESAQNEPHYHGGFKFCHVTGRGSDVISYVCRCERPELCRWVYMEINQAQPNSVYNICEASVG